MELSDEKPRGWQIEHFCVGCKCNTCTHPNLCPGNHFKGVPDCFMDECKDYKPMKQRNKLLK